MIKSKEVKGINYFDEDVFMYFYATPDVLPYYRLQAIIHKASNNYDNNDLIYILPNRVEITIDSNLPRRSQEYHLNHKQDRKININPFQYYWIDVYSHYDIVLLIDKRQFYVQKKNFDLIVKGDFTEEGIEAIKSSDIKDDVKKLYQILRPTLNMIDKGV